MSRPVSAAASAARSLSKVRRVEHHAALPYPEIADFMAELRSKDGIAADALEFAILTAARTGEVIGATWAEFDLEHRLWSVPGERMKAGRGASGVIERGCDGRVGGFEARG
jgi:integrase